MWRVGMWWFRANSYYFLERLSLKFGWRYVVTCVVVYGVQKGVGAAFAQVAAYWFMLYPKPVGLGWSNQRYTMALQIADIPWQIKAIFGIVSDFCPIWGYSRSPYMVLGSVAGIVAFALLAADIWHSVLGVCMLLMLVGFSLGVPELVVDATIAENIKRYPSFSTQLQSQARGWVDMGMQTLCWGSFSLFQMIFVVPAGRFVEHYGYKFNYLLCIFTSIAALYPGLRCWLGDGPIDKTETHAERVADGRGTATPMIQTARGRTGFWASFQDPTYGPVLKLAIYTAVIAVTQGFVGLMATKDMELCLVGLATTFLLSIGIWHWGRQVSPAMAKGVLMIFLTGALQPMSPILAVWARQTNTRDDAYCGQAGAEVGTLDHYFYETKWCHQCAEGRSYLEHGFGRPCFDAEFNSYITLMANLFGLVGAVLYNQYFGHWSYMRIFLMMRLMFISFGFTDLIWVHRWNVYWGISDKVFIVGQEMVYPTLTMMTTLPYLVLAAQFCPDRVEATLYALITGISQLSLSVGNYVGVGLVHLCDVNSPEYTRLPLYVLARNAFGIFPIVTILLLCPNGNPKMSPNEMRAVNNESLAEHRYEKDERGLSGYGSVADEATAEEDWQVDGRTEHEQPVPVDH